MQYEKTAQKSHGRDRWERESALQAGGSDDTVRPWIRGFVELLDNDEEAATYLLTGSGILSGCRNQPATNASVSSTSVR